ncbi:MAG: hypothetical protein V3R66_08345 [Rhodospirillales bacterium]
MSIFLGVLAFVGAIFGYSMLVEFPMRKFREKKPRGSKVRRLKAEIAELEKNKANLERDIEERKRKNMSELESSIATQKEAALNKISEWSEREEARLQKRFDQEYQTEIAKMKDASGRILN